MASGRASLPHRGSLTGRGRMPLSRSAHARDVSDTEEELEARLDRLRARREAHSRNNPLTNQVSPSSEHPTRTTPSSEHPTRTTSLHGRDSSSASPPVDPTAAHTSSTPLQGSRQSASAPSHTTISQPTSTPDKADGQHSTASTATATQEYRPLLLLANKGTKFVKSNKVCRLVSDIVRGHLETIEYRWSKVPHDEKNRLFELFVAKCTVAPGMVAEDYRRAFNLAAGKRLNDSYHRARERALKLVGGEAPTWEDAKKFPPSWTNQERWSKIMDICKVDLEFAKRSPAGKINREKLQIISTSGSKSHNDVRLELNEQLKRDATFEEWWKKTHMRKGTDGGDGIWASEPGREIMEAYMEMLVEKYPDDADRPTFDVVLWDKVIKSRSVGSLSRKQALGGLHPCFAESSCSVKGPLAHANGSSQSSELPSNVTNVILNDRITQLELTMKQVLEAVTRKQSEREPRRSHPQQRRPSSHYCNLDEEEEEVDSDYCSDYDDLQYRVRQRHYEDVGGKRKRANRLTSYD